MKTVTKKITQFIENFKNVHAEARKIGFAGIMRLLWKDLFVGRSLFQWLYLIALSSVPLILEFTQNTESHDWLSLFASWTGIVCVILVAEGRASNYLFGTINSAIYLILAMNATFYRINDQGKPEESHFEAKKLSVLDWLKYLVLTVIIWISMGLAYQSIHSARPFRDSVTDATNGVGQLLMTRLYREQWIFWIATNLFSIYLWWDENIHIQGMYWVYTLNSLVGWYQWTKAVRKEV